MRFPDAKFPFTKCLVCVFLSTAVWMIAGCGTGNLPMAPTGNGMTFTATVMGGRKPITNSVVTLRELGTAGKGSTPKTLGSSITNASGTFTINMTACTAPTSQVYITAAGGVATTGASTRNPNIALMAMLGPCNALPNNVVINELTTVAAVYSFARFINPTTPTNIGTTGAPGSTSYIGVTNAAAMLTTNLVNPATGTSMPVLGKNGNSPATLNTLADVLVACINSLSPFTPCTNLMTAATPSGGTAPTTTLQAAYDIATHPGNNVSTIYGILSQLPSDVPAPFKPTLSAAPNDWLLAVKFIPGDISVPRGMAIDQAGNIWIANAGTNSLTELSPLGVEKSPSGGYSQPG